MSEEKRVPGDMKAGLTGRGGARVKLSMLPRGGLNHTTRALEYGADKYARSNFHGPPPSALAANGMDPAVMRLLGYVDATMRHLTKIADRVNHAIGTGGDTRAACAVVDDDNGGGAFPPSMLPDLAHACASLMIGVAGAVDDGILPADPGRPWDALLAVPPAAELPQKDDPAAEKARVYRIVDVVTTPLVVTMSHVDARHKGAKKRRRRS